MRTLAEYTLLAVLYAPCSALLAVLLCGAMPRLNRFLDRIFTVQPGNRYRDESWHSKQPGERLRKRN